MHYYIDGYNLLFFLNITAHHALKNQRHELLQYLSERIAAVQIDVSLVFDAAFQLGESSRSHLPHLEIIFTAERESADEFIIDQIRSSGKNSKHELVVTSDKTLAWHARSYGAKTQGVGEFISWLEKCYQNKQRHKRRPPHPSPISKAPPTKIAPERHEPAVPPKISKAEECLSYYEQVFEARFQKLLKEEATERQRPAKEKSRHLFKKEPLQPLLKDRRSQNEKWLEAFENRLKEL